MSEQPKVALSKDFMREAEHFLKNRAQADSVSTTEDLPRAVVGDRLADLDMHKHQLRALTALAGHVCATRLTDGFCRSENRPECRCWQEADGLLKAMSSRGVFPVWFYQVEPEQSGASSQPVERA